MFEIVPSINAPDWETAGRQLELIAPHTDWVELDISNNTFAPTVTWNNPEDLRTFQTELHLRVAVHLMVREPESVVERWINGGVRRVIVHYETLAEKKGFMGMFGGAETRKKIQALSEQCHENWVEFGLSFLWNTPTNAIQPYLDLVDVVQILAVDPGPSGQEFHKEALTAAEFLRSLQSQFKFKIEWDGGVTRSNIRQIKNAGVNIAAVTSAVFGAGEPQRALEVLKQEALS